MKRHKTEIYNKAMHLLSLREHTRKELEQKLSLRGYSSADVLQILDELAEKNFQSDERFAESYVYSRSSKGYGPERVRMELQQRGVSESLVHEAMKQANIDWKALAQKVHQKKFGNAPAESFQEKLKQQQFMRYRGFDINSSIPVE